jgi:hypothetical protein
MNPPVVVNCRTEPYDLYVGRAPGRRGVFGNPYVIGQDGTRDDVVRKFEVWLRSGLKEEWDVDPRIRLALQAIERIPEGTRLGCFCKPLACHGDVIVKIWREMHENQA